MTERHPLDHPVWSSLTGPLARFALGDGPARRFDPEVSPFAAVDPDAEPSLAWPALAALSTPDDVLVVVGDGTLERDLPEGWRVPVSLPGYRMIADDLAGEAEPDAVVLGPADVPEMADLVRRTEPGPFAPRTRELGTYLGVRREGALVAMAGERMRVPGFTEISAVCTDPSARGQGLAGRLVRAVVHDIRRDGAVPVLHVAGTNVDAVRLYAALGFRVERDVVFYGLHAPAPADLPA